MSSPSARTLLVVLPLAVFLAACGGLLPHSDAVTTVVMTQDLGVGGDLKAVLAAAPSDQKLLADRLWAEKDTASFAKRVDAIAKGIAARGPDAIGVQSAMQWRLTAPASGSEVLVADYLDLLVAALASRGFSYVPVATTTTADVTLTGAAGDVYRVTDREVILARAGLATSAAASGTFVANRSVTIDGTSVPYLRGWAAVQIETSGKSYRLVSTHLDSADPAVQAAQAAELVRLAGAGPVVLAGGIGADPANAAWAGYGILTSLSTGFTDAVSTAGAAFPTCCRDAACVDPAAALDRREDVVMASLELQGWSGARVNGDPSAMVDGLWPSPHAGVVAEIRFR